MLGRRIAARPRPPATVRDLKIALLEEWNSIPQSRIDNLITSMANSPNQEQGPCTDIECNLATIGLLGASRYLYSLQNTVPRTGPRLNYAIHETSFPIRCIKVAVTLYAERETEVATCLYRAPTFARISWITNEEPEKIDGSGVTVTETRNIKGPGRKTVTAVAASESSVGVSKSGKQVARIADAGAGVDLSISGKKVAVTADAAADVALSKSGKKIAGIADVGAAVVLSKSGKKVAGIADVGAAVVLSKSGKQVARIADAGAGVDLSKSGKQVAVTADAAAGVALSKSGKKVAGIADVGAGVDLSKSGKKVAGIAGAGARIVLSKSDKQVSEIADAGASIVLSKSDKQVSEIADAGAGVVLSKSGKQVAGTVERSGEAANSGGAGGWGAIDLGKANGSVRTSGCRRITKLGRRIPGAISDWGTAVSAIGEGLGLDARSEGITGLIGITESGKEIDALPDETDVLGVMVDWDNNRESGELSNYEEVYWIRDGESEYYSII
ncbi:hypothetical protein TNCV_349931 [Trichonephila clavipes]|nr:hypothetical protein TNCV_349931 [Trichonephila clavipes]